MHGYTDVSYFIPNYNHQSSTTYISYYHVVYTTLLYVLGLILHWAIDINDHKTKRVFLDI